MIREKMRTGSRGVVLIVVVGVLAILSLLAATFGMIASVELAASRNQTEYEMARQAAHDGAEALINHLQTWLNGSSMTSGAVPDFLPNTADTDGQLLYRRDGVKVYMAVSPTVQTGSVTPDWLQGLGLKDAGMFNINAMGFANDLGSNCNPDIRYTSFDCSLVRLLTSRFATIATAPINSNDMTNLTGPGSPGCYPLFNDPNEQQRVAILLSRAIINWRHGPPPTGYTVPMPGTPGTEERRLGHLPRWSSRLNWIPPTPPTWNSDIGIGYPPTGNWGLQDFLPSLYVNVTDLTQQWSYAEPGVWTSYLGGGNWGNDQGLPFPGLFWGTVASYSAGTLTANTSQPGWRDWPPNMWNNNSLTNPTPPPYTYYIYFATGRNRWLSAPILTSTSTSPLNTLTLASALTYAPNAGDAFCIFTPTTYVGQLNKRWVSTDTNPEGDLVPNAMLWPNGALATEGNVLDLVLDSGVVSDAENLPTGTIMADTDAVQPKTWTTTFPNNSLVGNVVHIYGGIGRGQVRTITSYTNNTLTLSSPWTARNIPMTPWATVPPAAWTTPNPCQYRIELLDDNLPSKFQPNNLQGANRLYLSLGDLYSSVIVPALATDLGGNTANAQAVASILMPYFLPYLSVSTQASQASQSLCSINDWAVDGVDNVDNDVADGVVDNVGEAQHEQSSPQGNAGRAALAVALYNGLGLHTWAHAAGAIAAVTRVPQAAQLVANIIDFRDPTDVPTVLTTANLGETTVPLSTVYGAKGLHVTQVMPSPDPIYSALNGGEMTDNGSGVYPGIPPTNNWSIWVPSGSNGYWYVQNWTQPYNDNGNGLGPLATFTFDHLMPGYYAMRLIGTGGPFTLTYNGTPYTVTPSIIAEPENATLKTAFVRKSTGQLVCFKVQSNGTLSFQLQAPADNPTSQFWGFALCAQYIQLTNISTHDIRLDGLTVTTDQGPLRWLPSYIRADNGKVDLRRIPGAAVGTPGFLTDSAPAPSTATFPINYGTYVICMSEESYEKQWSAQSADPDYSTTANGDGIWGDAPNEAYTIYPFGDLNNDTQTMALLMGVKKDKPTDYQPSVTVTDPAGDLIAGGNAGVGYVDGAIPIMTAAYPQLDSTYHDLLICYSSIEKTVILQPTWDPNSIYWAPYVQAVASGTPPTALSASQNTLVIAQDDPPRVPAGAAVSFRACLNSNYGYSTTTKKYVAVWDPAATPTLFGSGTPSWPPGIVWYTDKRWATLAKPSYMASQNLVFPFILNRPYPTTGWLGLVPTSNTDAINVYNPANPSDPQHPPGSWRTIDPNPNPPVVTGTPPNATAQVTPPATPEQLLGTLMSNATVGGVYARFNINTAPPDTLKTVFPDATVQAIVNARNARVIGQIPTYTYSPAPPSPTSAALATASWATWDEFLNDPNFQYAPSVGGIGFYDCHDPVQSGGISNADAGAGTYADGFPDNSNEKKEWFMRFSNLFCLQSTSFRFTVAGLVYVDRPWDPVTMQNNEPVAMVRIEVDVDLSTGAPSIVHFRYLTQQ
jgi:hypothetical protein